MFDHNRQTIENPTDPNKVGAPSAQQELNSIAVVDPEAKGGPCAKRVVRATLVCLDGSRFVGTNDCKNPQKTCPREQGEGYVKCVTICQQPGHAERMAIKAAGPKANGGTMYIEGIDWSCDDCQRLMRSCSITWVFGPPTSWIEIAWRKRHSMGPTLKWVPFPESPYSIDEARAMYNSGLYDMATRNEPERAVLVIKRRAKPDPFRRSTFPPPRPLLRQG